MHHEDQVKLAAVTGVVIFLKNQIAESKLLLESDDLKIEEAIRFETTRVIHKNLKDTYKQLKKEMKNDDPKLVSENGRISQILNHEKMNESSTFWIG